MNIYHQFRVWLSKRWPLTLLVAVCVLLWLIQTLLDMPPTPITRTLGSSTQHVDVLWFRHDISLKITANDGGMVFAIPLTRDSLIAIDAQTGATVWKVSLSFERSGVRSMLANQNTVFIVTTLTVDAYNAKTGQFQWESKLGEGHVSIMSQLDSNILRVYYGDQIYELDSGTGKILKTLTKGATIWISGNTALVGFNAYDMQTGKLLWNEGLPFYIDEGAEPKDLGANTLLVAQAQGSRFSSGICALNLQTGKYSWCRPEGFNSMVAIDNHSVLGYAMRDDFVLLTIDLQTGKMLGETSFLSSEPTREELGAVSRVMVSNGIVVVSFGDSRQTFGLKIPPATAE